MFSCNHTLISGVSSWNTPKITIWWCVDELYLLKASPPQPITTGPVLDYVTPTLCLTEEIMVVVNMIIIIMIIALERIGISKWVSVVSVDVISPGARKYLKDPGESVSQTSAQTSKWLDIIIIAIIRVIMLTLHHHRNCPFEPRSSWQKRPHT